MPRLLSLAAALLLLSATPAAAAEMRTVELGFFAGYFFGDGAAGVEDNPILGLRAGYMFTRVHEMELVYDQVDTKFRSVNLGRLDEEFTTWSLNWVFNLTRPRGKTVPYGLLGLGTVDDEVTLPDGTPSRDSDLFIDFGGGVRIFTGDNFAFRLEGRCKPWNTFSVSQFNFEITAGLTWAIGRRR